MLPRTISALLMVALLIEVALQGQAQTISIQDTYEVYFSYLPLTPCPLQDSDTISSGYITYEILDPAKLFQIVQKRDAFTFWEADGLKGLKILAISEQLLQKGKYSQLLYFNSPLSSNTSRQFILLSFASDGNFQFNYATATLNSLTQVTSTIQTTVTTNFPAQIGQVFLQCLESNYTPVVSYMGESNYVAFCPGTYYLIVFDINNSSFVEQYDFSNITNATLTDAAPNAQLLLPNQVPDTFWHLAILLGQNDNILLCTLKATELICNDYEKEQQWIQAIAIRAFGLEEAEQQQEILQILDLYPEIAQMNFSGTIESIYNIEQITYVESILDSQTYLAIFENNQLLVNTSILGKVIFYGTQNVVVQNSNEALYLASFTLPYFSITEPQTSSYTLSYTCGDTQYTTNYSIFRTSFDYPSALVLQTDPTPKVTTQGVITYDLNSVFQVIGPAFQVYVSQNSQTPLVITLLTAPQFLMTEEIIAILDFDLQSATLPVIQFVIYIITSIGELKAFSSYSNTPQTLAQSPCGFTTIVSATKSSGYYLIYNEQGNICRCQTYLRNCTLQTTVSHNMQNANPTVEVGLVDDVYQQNPLRTRLYDYLNQGIVIDVFMSGLVVLQTVSGQILSQLQSSCPYNSTNVMIFQRNFQDDFIFIFCQKQGYIYQYLNRNNQLVFNRIAPLYGFTTRSNGSFFAGKNYVYVEVDIDPGYDPGMVGQFQYCCVLRIDPDAFTVSLISQVVEAQQLVFVQSLLGVDVVYYTQNAIEESNSFLKIYFTASWISFSNSPGCYLPSQQGQASCRPQQFDYNITFGSLLYNFAASFAQTIQFDLTASALAANPPVFELKMNLIQGPNPYYKIDWQFDLTWVCGPLSSFAVNAQIVGQEEEQIYSLITSNVVINNKLVQNLNSSVLQVLNLGWLLPNNTLSDLIMVVQAQSISFYIKFTDIWLDPLLTLSVPASNCLYFVFAQMDNTSAQLASVCYNTNIQSPRLLLVYDPAVPTLNATFAQINYLAELRSVISFPIANSSPLVFGLQEGPSKSITGNLAYCQTLCGTLQMYESTDEFLIDFDAFQTNDGQVMVVGLDLTNLSFWANPPYPTIQGQVIIADTVLGYRDLTGQYCDSVKLIQVSGSPFNESTCVLILSCMTMYSQIEVALATGSMTLARTYTKFANCDQIDRTKPLFYNPGEVEVIVVECLHNQETVRTQEFETINSSTSNIVTAYLQVYMSTGPQCGPNNWYPVRILPLATPHTLNTFVIYEVNSILKLFYQKMSGYMVDAFLSLNPYAELDFAKLTKQQLYPQLQLTLQNPYYSYQVPVQTKMQVGLLNSRVTILVEVLFAVTNLMTLVFLTCWIIFRRNGRQPMRPDPRFSLTGATTELNRESKRSELDVNDHSSRMSVTSKPPSVRRVTEIQLFQPRYQ